MRVFKQAGIAVGRCRGKTHAHQKRQIGDVVAHVGHVFVGEAGLSEHVFVSRGLEELTLRDAGDAEFAHALGHDIGRAAGDDAHFNAGFLQHFDAETVTDIETLEEFAAA